MSCNDDLAKGATTDTTPTKGLLVTNIQSDQTNESPVKRFRERILQRRIATAMLVASQGSKHSNESVRIMYTVPVCTETSDPRNNDLTTRDGFPIYIS